MTIYVIVKSRNPNAANVNVRVLNTVSEEVVSETVLTDGGAQEFKLGSNEALLAEEIAKPVVEQPVEAEVPKTPWWKRALGKAGTAQS